MTKNSDNAKRTGVIHFTIGESMGVRLMEISQEHLIYGLDLEKALKTLTDSLIGISKEMAIKILKGDLVLNVDVESQQIIATARMPRVHDKIFPKIDPIEWMKKMEREITESSKLLGKGWLDLQKRIRDNDKVMCLHINYDVIFKFISGNDEDLMEDLESNEEMNGIRGLIELTRQFVIRSAKIKDIMDWMFRTWDDFNETIGGSNSASNTCDFISLTGSINDERLYVMQLMQETLNLNFNFKLEVEDEEIASYIKYATDIDEAMKKGLEPVDIMEGYSAGWLSPEGVYYGLNGDIALMIHNQIAQGLQEAGIVPTTCDEFGSENNPDTWLEQNGWVKIHDNKIQYAGCLNNKMDKPNVNMSEKQIEIIYKYIQKLHGGIMQLGWRMERVSAARFEMMAKADILAVNKQYFSFD